MKMMEEKLGKNAIGKHFFFLTENKESPLTNLAKEFKIKTFEHHKTVGGRFSYLSNTALIPAAIAGLDIDEIRNGAMDTVNYLLNNETNFISDICGAQVEMFGNGIVANVVMPYIDRLYFLNEWYRQIWAESLGKGGNGTIPVNAMGTVDQHSQLQLYMDGPRNKFYTFIHKKKDPKALKIENVYNEGFNYLKNLSLDDIMTVEFESTVEVLSKRNLPLRVIKFDELNGRSLSQLLMQYMLETIICGKAIGVNPFGQHAVEERKILAGEMMKKIKSGV
jgi:glucose-6-phosphate isomerase